jgi:malate/lactate dehydrogenase
MPLSLEYTFFGRLLNNVLNIESIQHRVIGEVGAMEVVVALSVYFHGIYLEGLRNHTKELKTVGDSVRNTTRVQA